MELTSPKQQVTVGYEPIYLDSLRIDTVLDFDLFLRVGSRYVLYRNSNLPFTEKTRCNLLENKVEVDGNPNYIFKFGFMVRDLGRRLGVG